jgi:hypothetical protein
MPTISHFLPTKLIRASGETRSNPCIDLKGVQFNFVTLGQLFLSISHRFFQLKIVSICAGRDHQKTSIAFVIAAAALTIGCELSFASRFKHGQWSLRARHVPYPESSRQLGDS